MIYSAINALNWSTLKHIATSPLLYRWRINHPEPEKPAYVLGTAIHILALEPEKFDARYAVCEVTRNKRNRDYQEWLAENDGKIALKQSEMMRVRNAADALLSHPIASKILAGCRVEEPLVWTDPDTGMRCKGRVDAICPAYICDVKSCRDVAPWRFNRAASDYLYDGQVSFYHHGARELKLIDGSEMPYIVAVQSDEPHDVGAYQFKPEDLAAGRELGLSLMHKLEECIASDCWPGVAPGLQYLDLPPRRHIVIADSDEEW